MISSVSKVHFGSDQFNIAREGKHSRAAQAAQPQTEIAAPKKGKAGKVFAWVVGLAAAAFVGLGIAKGKLGDKWVKEVAEEGGKLNWKQHIKNAGLKVGEAAESLWQSIINKFSKKPTTTEELKANIQNILNSENKM